MKIQNLSQAPIFERPYGELQLLCGSKHELMNTEKADLKIIRIRPGLQTSHHCHLQRESIFHVVNGMVSIRSVQAGLEVELKRGDTVIVETGEDHVIENVGLDDAVMFEIESPPHSASDKILFGAVRHDIGRGIRPTGRFWRYDDQVKVKICGIKSLDAALECARLNVDAIGIHAVGQKGVERALHDSAWLSVIPHEMSVFLLTDSTDPSVLVELVLRTECDTVQIQGPKSDAELAQIAKTARNYGRRVVRTVSAKQGTAQAEVSAKIATAQDIVDAVLIDASDYGGTGQKHDWELTKSLRGGIRVPLIVAGGLNSANCVAAIQQLRPHGIDVESGVEMQFPLVGGGRLTAKDFKAIGALLEAVRKWSSTERKCGYDGEC